MALTPRLIVRLPAPALRGEGAIGVNLNARWLDSVRFVATSGTLGALVNGATYDGLTLATGDSFLYQPMVGAVATPGITNGIYVVGAGAPVRRSDADIGAELFQASVHVLAGTAGAGQSWINVNATPPNVGTDNITFRLFDDHAEEWGYASRSAAVAASIATTRTMVQTLSYSTPGDGGGAIWKRVGSAPSHAGKFQSSDGAWWEIASTRLDAQQFGAIGDGTTNDRTALADADGAGVALSREIYINKTYRVNSNLTMSSLVTFGPAGKLKPASGVTITLAGGFQAPPRAQIFDLSLGGFVWPTKGSDLNQYHYGAVNSGVADDTIALQATIDAYLYFMKSDCVRFEAGVHRTTQPLMLNYGDLLRSISIRGPGVAYGTSNQFVGLIILSDHWGCCIEAHGLRKAIISGMTLNGPFRTYIGAQGFGFTTPSIDPYVIDNWLPDAARTPTNTGFPNAGATAPKWVLNRLRMCAGIHIDPRGGTRPTLSVKTDVRFMATSGLLASEFENGDTYDGLTLATGDRFLYNVANDNFGDIGHPSNGIYVVQASGAAVRATDMDAGTEFVDAAVTVTAGTHAGKQFVCNHGSAPTVGTTNIDFRGLNGAELTYPDYTYPSWTGIAAQYGKAASSDVEIADCQITGFGCALAIKGCNTDGNADFIRMTSCLVTYNVYTMSWGNTQARLNSARDCSFAAARVHFSTGVIGQQNGKPSITADNVQVGNALDVIDMRNGGLGGGATFENCYSEGFNRFGSCRSGAGAAAFGLVISGGQYSANHGIWLRRPAYILDCDEVGVTMLGNVIFYNMDTPLIIRADPTFCSLNVCTHLSRWMTGTAVPASISIGEAIAINSTMEVMFLNQHQGPWMGQGKCTDIYSVTAGTGRSSRQFGPHARSSVTVPIPFSSRTASPLGNSSQPGSHAIAVSLGQFATFNLMGSGSFTSGVYSGRTLTITLNVAPSAGKAMQSGWVKGSIICDVTARNLFVVTDLTGTTMTCKQLNNLSFADVPLNPTVTGNQMYTVPTGQYTPIAGLELTYTTGAATVTFATPSGGNTYQAEFPAGAARVSHPNGDAMSPTTEAGSVISSSVAGTITFVANPRLALVERAALFYLPRP